MLSTYLIGSKVGNLHVDFLGVSFEFNTLSSIQHIRHVTQDKTSDSTLCSKKSTRYRNLPMYIKSHVCNMTANVQIS
jgi:hypothetical protein